MAKLAQLRTAKQALASIESERTTALNRGEDVARVDREAAILALTIVVEYLDAVESEAAPLRRLLAAFHVKNSPLLDIPGTQAMSPVEESVCGKIAGIAFLKSRTNGRKTREAAEWVANKLPQKLHKCLSPARSGRVSGRTVYEWSQRWGGDHGEAGTGRDGYRMIVDAGTQNPAKLPADQALVNILKALAASPGLSSN